MMEFIVVFVLVVLNHSNTKDFKYLFLFIRKSQNFIKAKENHITKSKKNNNNKTTVQIFKCNSPSLITT